MNRDLNRFVSVIVAVVLAYCIAIYSYFFHPLDDDAELVVAIDRARLPDPSQDDMLASVDEPTDETVIITDGDTLGGILSRLGIPSNQAKEAIEKLAEVYDPRSLKVDQEVYVLYEPAGDGTYNLKSMQFEAGIDKSIELNATDDGHFVVEAKEKTLDHFYSRVDGEIKISLYADAMRAGSSPKMVYDMIKALSYDVDFQRDIQPGDKFTLIYDTYKDEATGLERPGELLYAALETNGIIKRVYRFQPSGGVPGYYTDAGEAVRKALLRTPIDGARLSSGYGKRRHPVLGYSKMHKGVDFAAPKGTPIMAAGDGVVEKAGPFSSYGNYILLKHSGNTKTAYAHLSKFAVRSGQAVRQGQVIGYVGATGRATGPHLHFELLQNGHHVNPRQVTQLPTIKLAGKQMDQYKKTKKQVDRLMKDIPPGGSMKIT